MTGAARTGGGAGGKVCRGKVCDLRKEEDGESREAGEAISQERFPLHQDRGARGVERESGATHRGAGTSRGRGSGRGHAGREGRGADTGGRSVPGSASSRRFSPKRARGLAGATRLTWRDRCRWPSKARTAWSRLNETVRRAGQIGHVEPAPVVAHENAGSSTACAR